MVRPMMRFIRRFCDYFFFFLNLRKKILYLEGRKKLVTFVSFRFVREFETISRVETIHNLGEKGRILIEIIKYTEDSKI